MGRSGIPVLVRAIVLAMLVGLPAWAFAQSDATARRVVVQNELKPCLSLTSILKQDITVDQTAQCCSACVKVLANVATDATDYWNQLFGFRLWATVVASLVVFLVILGVSWWGIRRRWGLAFWLVPVAVAFLGALSVVLVERQVLADGEANFIRADRVLRDVAAVRMGYTTAGAVPLVCAEAIQQQGQRANSACASPLKQYPGLFAPGFEEFVEAASDSAKLEAVKERAGDAYTVLTLKNAQIQSNLRPASAQEVYENNLVFDTAAKEWLGVLKFDWFSPFIVFGAGLILAVFFGLIKKRINILRATRRQWGE